MASESIPTIRVSALSALFCACLFSSWLRADEQKKEKVPAAMLKEARKLEDQAKQMGPWAREAQVIKEAHELVFEQNNWTSESDIFTLGLINEISDISPWKPAERGELFLNRVQNRYDLSHDQRTLIDRELRQESMKVARKHFMELMPMALEIAQTRARQEPFTAEQVEKWAHSMEPLMDDALAAVQRVQRRVGKTMTPEQRERLAADMKAVVKRHHDVEKMIKQWKAGNWDPTQWGLQNDAIHAGAMAEYRMKQAEKNGLVEAALLGKKPDLRKTATDESAWERYVKWFCNYYKCDERQRTTARAILKDSTSRAGNYLAARRHEIDKADRLSETAESEAKRTYWQAEAARLRLPIGDIFANLCARLEKQVLTSAQQELLSSEQAKADADKAKKESAKTVAAKN